MRASIAIRVCSVALSLQCVTAASLRGTVLSRAFRPVSGANVRLLPEKPHGQYGPAWKVATNADGTFFFHDVAGGEYTVSVDSYPFVSAQVEHIHLDESADRLLRRILLEAGEGAGNCVVQLRAASAVQHTGGDEVQISGRVAIGRHENAMVSLWIFAEKDATNRSLSTDTGEFHFAIPVAGDILLQVELRGRGGRMLVPSQEVNLPWADLGDSISIPKLKLNREGLGHFCY